MLYRCRAGGDERPVPDEPPAVHQVGSANIVMFGMCARLGVQRKLFVGPNALQSRPPCILPPYLLLNLIHSL